MERRARRLSPLTPLARSSILVVAVAAATWRQLLGEEASRSGLVLIGLLVAGLLFGALTWLRTTYWIEEGELRIDTGLLSRRSRRIRIDRLQGVDIAQPLVARLFGLAEVRMDVAGGDREGSLAFLSLADAQALREVLLARRDSVRDTELTQPIGSAPVEPGRPEVPRTVLVVDNLMLLCALALSVEMVGLLASGAASVFLLVATGEWAGGSALLPVVAGLAWVLLRRFAGHYSFTLSETAAGLQARRGLFDLNAQTLSLVRVQGVVVSEPLLWRALGWVRVDVSVAGYGGGDESGPTVSTLLPVGRRAEAIRISRLLLGGHDFAEVPLTPPPGRARWVAPWRSFSGCGIGDHLIVGRTGMVVRRTHVVPHARVQSLRLTQGPVQRGLGLADLHVDSPPGPVRLRCRQRDAGEARVLLERESQLSAAARR